MSFISNKRVLKLILFGAFLKQNTILIEPFNKMIEIPNIQFKIFCEFYQLRPIPNIGFFFFWLILQRLNEQIPLFRQWKFSCLLDNLDFFRFLFERIDIISHFLKRIKETLLHQLTNLLKLKQYIPKRLTTWQRF